MATNNMMKEAIQALYPPRQGATRRRVRRSSSSNANGSFHQQNSMSQYDTAGSSSTGPSFSTSSPRRNVKSRFSELLLEHGEKDLHLDWAVSASSSPLSASPDGNNINQHAIGGSCRMQKIEGRLRLCSQSIVFEPRQTSRGIVRVPFRHMMYLGGGIDDDELTSSNHRSKTLGAAIVRCDRHIVMKANNAIGPFDYVQAAVEFRFTFQHSAPATMLSLAGPLFDVEAANRKSSSVSFAPSVAFNAPPIIPLPSNDNARDEILEQMMTPTLNGAFDTTNFLHAKERPLTPNLRCSIKKPLLEERGCAILTENGLYFQPVVGSGSSSDVGSGGGMRLGSGGSAGQGGGTAYMWPLEDMRAIARRYDGMKDCALEIYFAKNQHSILLAFESTLVREQVVRVISQEVTAAKSRPLPCYTDRYFVESALELWQAGELDNFEYLLCLNSAAGRSFHDLSRYPVFPWVLSSYGECSSVDDELDDLPPMLDLEDPSVFRDLSKPIGALNGERFEEFRRRYESMVHQQKSSVGPQHGQDAPFLYGTHYSAPGYVLFYLLRVMPEHMLCLQSGKFDVPDRLFHSINTTYESVLTNPGDVKELIPEFFDADCFDFLINSSGLQLGNLQTGERVNDVLLPPWAKSAKHFLRQNRAALESEYCTKQLPRWIDLIFGAASRGKGAKDANNVFHPMTYIGPEDMDAIHSPEDRARAELQSGEFGIVPDQLFCRKHPGKSDLVDAEALVTRDRLRESYGVKGSTSFPASISAEQDAFQNGIETTTNPFD